MRNLLICCVLPIILVFSSCNNDKSTANSATLYNQHCSSCHLAPKIKDLPKKIWAENILPDMAARMGLRVNGYDPYEGLSNSEKEAWIKTLVYPPAPIISEEEWNKIETYVLDSAPEELKQQNLSTLSDSLVGFKVHPIKLNQEPGSLITFLDYDVDSSNIITADMQGRILYYNFNDKTIDSEVVNGSPIVDIDNTRIGTILTRIGIMNPSERKKGNLQTYRNNNVVTDGLHRPVNTLVVDLNRDGNEEFIVSEFGHLTGQLTLLSKLSDSTFAKRVLLRQPGLMRVIPRDMDGDGLLDLVALTTQGDESITVLYQERPLEFSKKQVIRFSPVWGTSWFELLDYDSDGDMDIITAHGDNADKSVVPKPYHGIRIYLNASGIFKEAYFYPINGATRVMARDFDKDGDIDLACVSTFPDYENHPERTFVYLENLNDKFQFRAMTFSGVQDANWFLINAADVDNDGDEDIFLSSFSYPFSQVDVNIKDHWQKMDIDIMILENLIM